MVCPHPVIHMSDSNWEFVRAWTRVGLLSFGGPAAQIALMHRVVVEEKHWLDEKQFLNALNFCMLLPGPEAMQLATYAGWRLKGVWGGLVSGLLFVLPGALLILILASLYASYGNVPLVQAAFTGIKAAVVVIVIEALVKLSRRALSGMRHVLIALLAFVAMFALAVPFPLVVLVAGFFGFLATSRVGVEGEPQSLSTIVRPGATFKTIAVWLGIWFAPVALLWLMGAEGILIDIALFFSKLAVVTFGGAYAVLAFMAQDVVASKGWLEAGEMVDGLGLAETTPGPLILVTQFVGFLAAEKAGGFWLGLVGAVTTLWVTFAPCFLWIFAGAPYIEWISSRVRLRGALAAITAAVVGVILNLSVWFAITVLFQTSRQWEAGPLSLLLPEPGSLDIAATLIAIFSGLLLLVLRWNMLSVIVISGICGLGFSALHSA